MRSVFIKAAINRVMHRTVILEFDVPNYRTDAGQQPGQAEGVNRQNRLMPNRQIWLMRDKEVQIWGTLAVNSMQSRPRGKT